METWKAEQNKACKAQECGFFVLWSLPDLFPYFLQINNKACVVQRAFSDPLLSATKVRCSKLQSS